MQSWTHIPILAKEIAELLLRNKDGVYVDGTLGLGGHTKYFLSLLSPRARVLGFDRDEEALSIAKERVNDPRLTAYHASYTEAPHVLAGQGLSGADGALFDLGLSSYQLDNPARGFSIINNGPLDMRFDLQSPLSAEVIVNTWPMDELERIIRDYGEDSNANKIALAVMQARRAGKISTTEELKKIVESVVRGRGKIHPATQTFQALRIAVNNELGAVESVLKSLEHIVKPGGRAAVLSFHSLEDRLIKNQFKEMDKSGAWKLVNKKVIVPAYEEVRQNRRARSAKLRVIERI